MRTRPKLTVHQRRTAQQQTIRSALFIPQGGFALDSAQVRLKPARVIGSHRPDKPIVRQLEPGGSPPLLRSHQVRIHKCPDGVIIQSLAAVLCLQHLAANTLFGDELSVTPFPDIPLAATSLVSRGSNSLGVIVRQ